MINGDTTISSISIAIFKSCLYVYTVFFFDQMSTIRTVDITITVWQWSTELQDGENRTKGISMDTASLNRLVNYLCGNFT